MLYEKLDYVLAIAEEENLTRAAQKLYISQPTLTMYLNRLEESLGVKLFDRKKNPIKLTEAGKYYIKKMNEIAVQEQLLRSEIRTVSNPAENFSIAMGRVRGHHWLPPLVRTLTEKYPQLNIQAVQTTKANAFQMLSNGHLDLALGSYPQSMLQTSQARLPLCKQLLSREAMLLVAHKKFRLVPEDKRASMSPDHPYVIEPQGLNHLPFIAPIASNAMYYNYNNLLKENEITPGRTITILNMSTGLSMVAEGLGVQLINASILNTLDYKYSLENLDFFVLPDSTEYRECYSLWPRDSIKSNYIKEAINILRNDILAKLPYNDIDCSKDATIEEL